MASSAADVPIGGSAADVPIGGPPTEGGVTGAAGAAAGILVPPFGGNDVIGQLNVWAASVDAKLDILAKASEENKDRSLLLRTEIWDLEKKTQDNLQQVANTGLTALTTTIENFKIELGKHEYAHSLARSQIEAVVVQAEAKFQELERVRIEAQKALFEGFNSECIRRETADKDLRERLQTKFVEVQSWLQQVQGGGAQGGGGAPVISRTSADSDPLQAPGGDAWARFVQGQATGAGGGAAAMPGAASGSAPAPAPPGFCPPRLLELLHPEQKLGR